MHSGCRCLINRTAMEDMRGRTDTRKIVKYCTYACSDAMSSSCSLRACVSHSLDVPALPSSCSSLRRFSRRSARSASSRCRSLSRSAALSSRARAAFSAALKRCYAGYHPSEHIIMNHTRNRLLLTYLVMLWERYTLLEPMKTNEKNQ